MDRNLIELVNKVKLLVTHKVALNVQREKGILTSTDAFALESLDALNQPTIGKFASFIGISQPNASYKVQTLIKKGYIKRIHSEVDKRECMLALTDEYVNLNRDFNEQISNAVQNAISEFSNDEIELLDKMLEKVNKELDKLLAD